MGKNFRIAAKLTGAAMGAFRKIFFFLLTFLSLVVAHVDSAKTVLYLGGGARSPWYSLGVLYAARDYRVPVDSVVGTSWGAFVGALWSAGFELDDIQRILNDSLFISQVLPKSSEPPLFSLPISLRGEPALAFRFAFFGDSAGRAHLRPKPLEPDGEFLKRSLFRVRLQEALTRTDSNLAPFTAMACSSGTLVPASAMDAIPFSETSGENCPFFFPGDSVGFSIYAVAYPVRSDSFPEAPLSVAGFENALSFIRAKKDSSRPVVVIRPHSFAENSPLGWMRAGYSDFERKLGELSPLAARKDVSPRSADSILPRFRFEPSFEEIPTLYYSDVSAYWDDADTGIDLPSNFLKRISASPFYDSVQIKIDSAGIAKVSAVASPVLEFRVGGFGSNLMGPLAYFGADFRFVNQFEYALSLDGYVGEHSYALAPEFQIRGMFKNHGKFSVRGNVSRRRPLTGYFSGENKALRIKEIRENDVTMAFAWKDSLADFALDVLLGKSEFETFHESETRFVDILYPRLSFDRSRGGFEDWFGDRGYRVSGSLGFRSVNLEDGTGGDAPLYLASTLDLRKNFAPTRFFALGFGALAGIHIRRESGEGYVYPSPLATWTGGTVRSVDSWYRMHPALSPWTSSWNFVETGTHHYAAARMNLGLHGRFLGAWIFFAYMRDFEENPDIDLDADRLLLEPTLRFAYRTLDVRLGLNRMVSAGDFSKLKNGKDYRGFFQVGANW